MEELLSKVKDAAESSFIKDLLKKLKIQFETLNENNTPSDDEVKQSVLNGKSAYKKGEAEQFERLDRKDIWK